MGKKRSIKAFSAIVALVAVHKILAKYTTKPESRKHLEGEIDTYSEEAFDKSREHTWTKEELIIIKEKAINETKNKLLNKYSDIKLGDSEIKEFVVDSMQELFLK